MNAAYYMTGEVEPSFVPETFVLRIPSEMESHCRWVAVDARARMLGIARSCYPSMDMSLIEAAYCPEVPEEECIRLVAESIPIAEKLMQPVDVNPHYPSLQSYSGKEVAVRFLMVDSPSPSDAAALGESSEQVVSQDALTQ